MKALFCLCDNKSTLCPVHNFEDFIKAETSPKTLYVVLLNRYIREWKALDSAYDKIRPWPVIGFIKQMRNLNQQHKLTKKFNNDINSLQTLKK